jgi:hypothetical protein
MYVKSVYVLDFMKLMDTIGVFSSTEGHLGVSSIQLQRLYCLCGFDHVVCRDHDNGDVYVGV